MYLVVNRGGTMKRHGYYGYNYHEILNKEEIDYALQRALIMEAEMSTMVL